MSVSHYKAELLSGPSILTLEPGEIKEICIEFCNKGNVQWNEKTGLGTIIPRDRESLFYNDDWLSPSRLQYIKGTVEAGETYKFFVKIRAPFDFDQPISESFGLVQEGIIWFEHPHGKITIDIRPPAGLIRTGSLIYKKVASKIKILYLSCHETLEHAELTILNKLGFDVFPVGIYSTPEPSNPTREGTFIINKDLQNKFMHHFGKSYKPGNPIKLNADFIKHFDIIINCHWLENFTLNLTFLKNKPVIWRTIGLSNAPSEKKISQLKQQLNMKIVRMTPLEPATAGCDAIIRTQIDPNEFNGWIGDEDYVLTIQKWTRLGEIGRLANEYQDVTNGLNRKLCGRDNKGFDCIVDNPTQTELQNFRQHARVYFSLATQHASATYTFIEAMMTGMPVVSVGKRLARTPWFENISFIENGVSGFVSDEPKELRHYIELLLKDYDLAKKIGANARESVIKAFHPDLILHSWASFFEEHFGIKTDV